MPRASVWMIRTSLLYFGLGLLFGALMLIQKAFPLNPVLWMLLPMHIEIMLFGWLIQLVLGVAYWIFPRFVEGKARGNETEIWITFVLFNLGIVVDVISALVGFDGFGTLLGRLLQIIAVGFFIHLHWARVTTYRHLH